MCRSATASSRRSRPWRVERAAWCVTPGAGIIGHHAFFRSFAWLLSVGALMSAATAIAAPAREAARAGAPIQSHARFCELMARKLPNVTPALCDLAQLQPGPARSVKGHNLLTRDVVAPNATLRVLVVGGVHGDELSSTSLVLHWIGAAQDAPANIHWRFVPLMNPDGHAQGPPHAHQCERRGPEPQLSHAPLGQGSPALLAAPHQQGPAPLSRAPGPVRAGNPLAARRDGALATPPDRGCACPLWRARLRRSGGSTQEAGQPGAGPGRHLPGSLGNYGGVHRRCPW